MSMPMLHHRDYGGSGAYRTRWLVVRGSCTKSAIVLSLMLCLHSRSLLSSEALEQHLCVAVDAQVLDGLGILGRTCCVLPGRRPGERRAQGVSESLHRDCESVTKAEAGM